MAGVRNAAGKENLGLQIARLLTPFLMSSHRKEEN